MKKILIYLFVFNFQLSLFSSSIVKNIKRNWPIYLSGGLVATALIKNYSDKKKREEKERKKRIRATDDDNPETDQENFLSDEEYLEK